MSHPVLTLELPEDVYERVRRAAKGMNQPVEKALVNIVRAATPSLEKVPAEYRAELEGAGRSRRRRVVADLAQSPGAGQAAPIGTAPR